MVITTMKSMDMSQDSGEMGESISQVRIRVTLADIYHIRFWFSREILFDNGNSTKLHAPQCAYKWKWLCVVLVRWANRKNFICRRILILLSLHLLGNRSLQLCGTVQSGLAGRRWRGCTWRTWTCLAGNLSGCGLCQLQAEIISGCWNQPGHQL